MHINRILNTCQEKEQNIEKREEKSGFQKNKPKKNTNLVKICYKSYVIYQIIQAN